MQGVCIVQKPLTGPFPLSLISSWQVGLHGRQLWAQAKWGIRVPHHPGGVTQRDAGPWHLQHQVQVHRWWQTRPPVLGVEPHYQERLERLISPRHLLIDVFPLLRPSFLLAIIPFCPFWTPLWIMCQFKLLLSPSIDLLLLLILFLRFHFSSLNSSHSIIPPIVTFHLFAPNLSVKY